MSAQNSQATALSASVAQPKVLRGQGAKRAIHKCCMDVLNDPKSKPSQRLTAAKLLRDMIWLAKSRSQRKKRAGMGENVTSSQRIEALTSQAA